MRTVGNAVETKTTVQPAGSTTGVTLRSSIVDECSVVVEECSVAAHVGPRSIHAGGVYPVGRIEFSTDSNNNHDHYRSLEATTDHLNNHQTDDHSWSKCGHGDCGGGDRGTIGATSLD
ncbi:hypothetical protein PV325_010729 [Microctonus aethiopoides]|uniref:Uncharacterized protein n=1 Tax=Microctonus aethiopoides TaxID=144406 RepID=A0AA39EXP1_9HYME|nr:hypothetical protein PV325_010729 [Microctonus aethiopoides]KAK0094761.1 hypothetical protein PV326_010063 [Microctonus aethiopoides]KAK0158714.1 hypothetical protein PV328_009688 [Microctonus aethiopoides]